MSLHCCLLEDTRQDLRQVKREVQRQMRLLELHLQQLCEELPVSCLCQSDPSPWERRTVTVRLDVEQELDSTQRRLNRVFNSSHDDKLLALTDVKGFDPEEVTVTVKDGKVKVLAEHEEERTTARGKEYQYRNIVKEISLPLGVSGDEVTCSLGLDSIMKIKKAHKCCPCLLSH